MGNTHDPEINDFTFCIKDLEINDQTWWMADIQQRYHCPGYNGGERGQRFDVKCCWVYDEDTT